MQQDGMRVLQPAARRCRSGSRASTWFSSMRTRCGSFSPIPVAGGGSARCRCLVADGDAGPEGSRLRSGAGVRWAGSRAAGQRGRGEVTARRRDSDCEACPTAPRPRGPAARADSAHSGAGNRDPRSHRLRRRVRCGSVARLVAGDSVETALRHAAAMGARNAGFRGASGLSRHLRGELVTP